MDIEFDTRAVKITPAHVLSDYNLGKKHNLEFINSITNNRLLNANTGTKFDGQKRFNALDTGIPPNVRFTYMKRLASAFPTSESGGTNEFYVQAVSGFGTLCRK